MIRYHTYKTIGKMNNQIYGISPSKWGEYEAVVKGSGGYIDNLLSNELFCWLEG